jgi:zinc transporter ZupT
MNREFLIPFGATLLAAAFTTAGLFTIRHFEKWARQRMTLFICFAAGVLISASLLHLIPESLAMTRGGIGGPVWVLAGFLGLYLFNWFFTAFVCERRPIALSSIGLIPLLGIGFHSFVDGFIYSVSFTVSLSTGVLTTIGMVLHEFPEGIVTYLLLLHGGLEPRGALRWTFAAAALTTPLGMVVSHPFVRALDDTALGRLLALSAGALIYVGASHLLPETEQERTPWKLVALIAGVAVTMGIVLIHDR